MTLDEIARAIDRTYIDGAKARYSDNIPKDVLDSFVESLPEILLSATDFVTLIASNQRYNILSPSKVLDLFHEIKIQTAFIMVTYAQFNTSVYDQLASRGNADEQITIEIHLLLKYLSLTQDVVIKSRILFERIMNLIYYLENGSEIRAGSRNRKKRKFYRSIDGTSWSFLLKYKTFIDAYDQRFRAAEVHAGSFLKRHLAGKSLPDSDVIMSLSNFLMNVFWENLKQILMGRSPVLTTWNKGMESLVGMAADDVRLP